MSQQYQVLARKYRPKNFHELVGQTHVSKALINAIDHNRLHHAYLFTGTRGVGKTTIARILSKCLNCETGVTSTPCGVCSSCVAIDQGRFIDLIEIDAASRTKVEDTRELIDNVPYAPTQGRYKVYLIDEVHMLSTHSFNALLKTLEEPPSHVKFLLATTDPQKLPITIISRCLQFVLRPLPQQALSDHIAHLLTQEGIAFTQPALWQLANAAKGSVRDALSLTDQAIAFGQGSLTDETVNDMLGLIDNADLVQLLLDIYQGDTESVSAHIEQMRAQMVDAGSMFDGLAELLHQIAMVQLLPNVALNVNDKQAEQIKQLASIITADVLQLYYQIVVQGREQIKLANTPLQALEMCLLRLLAFRPLAINEVPTPTVSDSRPAVASTNEATVPQQAQAAVPAQDTREHEMSTGTVDPEPDEPYSTVEAELETKVATDTVIEPSTTDSLNANSLQQADDYNGGLDNPNNLTSASSLDDLSKFGSETIEVESNVQNLDNSTQNNTDNIEFESDYQLNALFTGESDLQSSVSYNNADSMQSVDAESDGIAVERQTFLETSETHSNQNQSSYQPPTDQPANSEIHSQLAAEDPRSLLKCVPIELVGQWTPEKWDYWLQTARESGALAYDQLAMARQGVMTGEISGESVFKVAFDTKNMQSIFKHLANHLSQQFGAQVSIAVDTSLNSDNQGLLPQNRQKVREVQAKDYAKQLLTQSPVMQRLIRDFKGEIVNLKLLTDAE
ncbi:DNA polymerase III subunit gamma/tau [Psychrobacter phenylpyruvicus]|uniref:DNA polymerase III subunit gamma/tau n=1 Tax=Psychrobacter phenylpyruvicus TaxID=29432 RepID=A0A379LKB9_9GAMM|nr:DNA polymerase III subunit gamma/tau [Psychrobacter phenylpyruvicus]SUD90998.1 DNA polymerase III subunit tau [Psychrobacter phenylpyruvicus]